MTFLINLIVISITSLIISCSSMGPMGPKEGSYQQKTDYSHLSPIERKKREALDYYRSLRQRNYFKKGEFAHKNTRNRSRVSTPYQNRKQVTRKKKLDLPSSNKQKIMPPKVKNLVKRDQLKRYFCIKKARRFTNEDSCLQYAQKKENNCDQEYPYSELRAQRCLKTTLK